MTTSFTTRTAQHPSRAYRGVSALDRFWSKVNKDGPTQPHMDSPCWVWTASTAYYGYGQFNHDRTHRVSWELTHGPISTGKNVLHRCDNPPCCNPAHLFLGNQRDNALDMVAKGRWRGPQEEHFSERFTSGGWAQKLTPELVDSIRSASGTQRVIAAQFGITQSVVSRIKNGRRWARQATAGWSPPIDPPKSGQRGATHFRAVLSDDDVRSMRRRAANGEKVAHLAREFNVSANTAKSAIRGRTWRNVHD